MEPTTATNTVALGLTFGGLACLASIMGFIWYAKRTPGVQTWAYMWGLANGAVGCYLVAKIPGWGPWLDRGLGHITSDLPIPKPDWLTPEMLAFIGPGFGIFMVWAFVTKLLGWNPSLGASGGGRKGGGNPQQQRV
jgi:hypothetical protein